LQSAILLLRVDDIVSGVSKKKGSSGHYSGGGVSAPQEEAPDMYGAGEN